MNGIDWLIKIRTACMCQLFTSCFVRCVMQNLTRKDCHHTPGSCTFYGIVSKREFAHFYLALFNKILNKRIEPFSSVLIACDHGILYILDAALIISLKYTWSSVYPRMPLSSSSAAVFMTVLISSYVAFFSRRTVRSTTDTSGTGTRKAIPVSFLQKHKNTRYFHQNPWWWCQSLYCTARSLLHTQSVPVMN